MKNLISLRVALKETKLDGFILPVNDEFMGEYVPDSAKRLTWLTGFTGSAGMAVVLQYKAAFFTDGRYTLQAKAEVQGFELYNSGETSPEKWLSGQSMLTISYDPKLHTLQMLRRFEQAAPNVIFKAVSPNPIDALWQDRPEAPASMVRIQPEEFAGETSESKRARIGKEIAAKGADIMVLTAPDCICWLLNIRGSDVPFTPFVLSYALLKKSREMVVYLDEKRLSPEVKKHLGEKVVIKKPEEITNCIAKFKGVNVLYDPASSPVWIYQQLSAAEAIVIEGSDPCMLPKACKNKAELKAIADAHKTDGLAVTKFLYWLDKAVAAKEALNEMMVAEKLESFRTLSPLYLEPSFTTISGSGPNGAIVHYRVTEATNRPLDNNSLLLVDSGGQYQGGTTDITRTVVIGTPSAEMKNRFTLVLKGHIALARAVFPKGTTGTQLDALARQYLWAEGLDYDHGTGHGVGSYLSVHEGPQGISKRMNTTALQPGMILSNEPGYYKTGEYGIRIENLVTVKESNKEGFLEFETLTLAPLDLRLVDMNLLTVEEKNWLKDYHQKVYHTHHAELDKDEAMWLKPHSVAI